MTTDLQTVIAGLSLLGGIGWAWSNLNIKIRALEVEVRQLQKTESDNNKKFDSIMAKIEVTNERIEVTNGKINDLILQLAKNKSI